MNIDKVKSCLTPEERAEAAAALREMLDKRRYTGWTGKAGGNLKCDYMCDALVRSGAKGAALAKKAIETQLNGYITLGSYLELFPRSGDKHEGHRRTVLRWWREFIKALESQS